MCRNIEGYTSNCAFKRHDLLKCPKGHPLHLSNGKTFLCCRSGCDYIRFFTSKKLVELANREIDGYTKEEKKKLKAKYDKERYQHLRAEQIKALGSKCISCGNEDIS
jgi:hypothetical protein